MKTCRLCRSNSPDSEEHLFQSAIGGRRKVRGVLCVLCNGLSGRNPPQEGSE
jgi:hypothetical protein